MTAARKLEAVETEARDYVGEMRALIDAETADGPYVAPVIAEHVVKKLRATDPDLLAGWLDAQAVHFVRAAILARDCSTRSHARVATRRSQFAVDSKLHAAGESTALVHWLAVPFVVDGGSRKAFADLTAADLDYVASDYERRAADNQMTASFMRALIKKVGKRRVGDVYDNATLTAMWQSLSAE